MYSKHSFFKTFFPMRKPAISENKRSPLKRDLERVDAVAQTNQQGEAQGQNDAQCDVEGRVLPRLTVTFAEERSE